MAKASMKVKNIKNLADQHCADIEFDQMVDSTNSVGKSGTHLDKIDVNKQYGGRYTNMPK